MSDTASQTCGIDATSLVGLAVLAPSSHNTRRWRFRTSDTAVDVFADRTRALPASDPEDRELTIGCGCAVFNLQAAAAEGAWLRPIQDEADRETPAHLVAEGDAVQWSDPGWRRELAAWMHPRRQGDGLTVPGLAALLTHFVVRTFDMGGGIGANDRELAEASPLMAVLGTERDDPIDWLATGQALQRVLLAGCQDGLQASLLNQPAQVASLRPKLQTLVTRAVPQRVLRLGHPEGDMPATPCRPIRHVVETARRGRTAGR